MSACSSCEKRYKSDRTFRFICKTCNKTFCSSNKYCIRNFIKLGGPAGFCSYECCPDEEEEYRQNFRQCSSCQEMVLESTTCNSCKDIFCKKKTCCLNEQHCEKEECQVKLKDLKTCNICKKVSKHILRTCECCCKQFCRDCSSNTRFCIKNNCSDQMELEHICHICSTESLDCPLSKCEGCHKSFCKECEFMNNYCNTDECKALCQEETSCRNCGTLDNMEDYIFCTSCNVCYGCCEYTECDQYNTYNYCSEICCPDDYVQDRTCSQCFHEDLKAVEFRKCKICKSTMCDDCFEKDGILDEIRVDRYGYDTNHVSHHLYCSDCCPDSVYEKIHGKDSRKYELQIALESVGAEIRSDSSLCRNYIENNMGQVEQIVKRMCEMKYLFEYHHDMPKYLQRAREEHDNTLAAGYFPDTTVLDDAESGVMRGRRYPRMWCFPWQTIHSLSFLFQNRSDFIPGFLAAQYNINRCIRNLQKIIKERIYHPNRSFVHNIHQKNLQLIEQMQQVHR